MPLAQTQVGEVTPADGANPIQRAGRQGDTIVSELHGKYCEQMIRGRLFKGKSATAGIALIVAATTGNHPTLFNPAGSGVNLSLVRLMLTYVSGTNAPTAITWNSTVNAGSTFATGAPIVTATFVPASPALLGGTGIAKGLWAPTVITFVAAPAYLEATGIALDTMAAASTNAPFVVSVDYDGTFGVAPGNAISLCTNAATTTALFQVTLIWEEIPL